MHCKYVTESLSVCLTFEKPTAFITKAIIIVNEGI